MKKILSFLLLVVFVTFAMKLLPVWADEKSPNILSADSILPGCSVVLSEIDRISPDHPTNVSHEVEATWRCQDGGQSVIDTYAFEGGSPEVVTVFYWKNKDIISLVRWPINSQAADYSGYLYAVYIYKGMKKDGNQIFVKDDATMKKLPFGFDGYKRNGSPVRYPYKDAASIKRRLSALHFDE
ncbi:hypothetical protein [Paraburkholderia atlantica]|uniref:hypothetical protein n=1 Tax=Paraburkholderia atlantica TaxID=2654982 RepID=UPI0016082F99|nr:hypothetical protein [Paraburkholderia atlantica]MBB5507905.1 hypothetical protein [Paraburkholderia atlantica]